MCIFFKGAKILQQAIPSLDSKGWILSPIEIVKYVIGDYMVADHNQSSLLPQVRCFIQASGRHNSNPNAVCDQVKEDLEILLKNTLTDLEVIVSQTPRKDESGQPTSAYDINVTVTSTSFSENQEQSHLSYAAVVKDGFVENHIFTYTEDK